MKNSVCLKRMLAILVFGCHALFAQAVTFYFLPPDNDNWVAGNSYIFDGDNAELMGIHTRCGWFQKRYDSKDDVPERVMIYLGKLGKDKIDLNGIGASAEEPAWIPLRTRFGSSATLYLYLDPNSEDPLTFRTTAPPDLGEEKAGRCSYKMAAFIYDTDMSVNSSFSGTYTAPSTANANIRRGIVAPTLDTTTKKPTFIATPGYANWKSKESFDAAFTPGGIGTMLNVPRCYDMPFGRATNGTNWEFDSDKMRTPDGSNLVGGFFPYILDSAYNDDGSRAEYAEKCPACNKKYTVACFQNPSTATNNMTKVWRDSTYRGIDAFDRTYIPDGTALGTYYGSAPAGCAVRPGPGNGGSSSAGTTNRANLSFCFESHAQFTYEKGQEFLFRGDDDIWIFINNQLVIDLGGIHNAAPGYVDLDTIKVPETLVEGKIYPIDIFFCERMATQSNVRVSTNMYITQKSSFTNEIENAYKDNVMCASIASGNDCASKNAIGGGSRKDLCAEQLIANNYTVDFYMINRSNNKDTLWLSPEKNRANCQGNANNFTCYAKDGVGITVIDAVYSCGGRYQCKGSQKALDKVDIPSGSYTVWARLMDGKSIVPGTQAINIDGFKGPTNARLVWGRLSNNGELLDAYEEQATKREQSVIAGKPTPIYVAVGSWEDNKYTVFDERDLDAEDVVKYSISITGNGAEDLDVCADKLCKRNAEFPRTIPLNGIDTVWVNGGYDIGEREVEINLGGVDPTSAETPSMKLKIYQPRLRFTTKADNKLFFNNARPNTASGYLNWDTEAPYVGKPLEVFVVALDTNRKIDDQKGEVCSHCTFPLKQTSKTNNSTINEKWPPGPNGIVQGNNLKIDNGRQTIYIRGQDIVNGTNYADWQITGPSKELTWAKWDSLQFRDAPIPMPLYSELYDRNGDGIGDSLRIKFAKPFKSNGKIIDSLLPIIVEVEWEKGYTVAFHSPEYNRENLKDSSFVVKNYNKTLFTKNREYWEKYLEGDSIIVIANDTTTFSKGILTSGYNSGSGKLSSYTPFYDQSQCQPGKQCLTSAFVWRKYESSVLDRVPPIVVKAEYKLETEKKCGSSKDDACRESIVAYLSEPIFAAPNADKDPYAIKNPFSYCFEYSQPKSKCSNGKGIIESDRRSQKWDNLNWVTWELPQDKPNSEDVSAEAKYKPNNKPYPKEYYENVIKGDSIVELIYYAYKYDEESSTHMPKADDWIKIRPPSSSKKDGFDVFYDAAGNSANPRERGVLITGRNQNNRDKVVLAGIDKEADPEDPPFGGIFTPEGRNSLCQIPGHYKKEVCAGWMSDDAKRWADDNLYDNSIGGVTEFLPIYPANMDSKEVRAHFPGSVGAIFSSIKDEVNSFCGSFLDGICRDEDGDPIKDENGRDFTKETIANAITLHASVYYHTNLGNYTAHRNPVLANCTDKVFESGDPKDPAFKDNCLGNEYGFYLAWNLKTNKNRFVGTGAYVAITKYYWQLRYKYDGEEPRTKKFNQDEVVELYGVHRYKTTTR